MRSLTLRDALTSVPAWIRRIGVGPEPGEKRLNRKDDTLRSRWHIAVIGVALCVPLVLALMLFPTPSSDTRELFAWGKVFTLATPKHPPMMQWIGGATERLFGVGLPAAVLVNQLLNAVGIGYHYGILRLFLDRPRALLFTVLLAASLYGMVSALPYALNADMLQFPIWAAIIFHAILAARSDKLVHWLALGVWCALAVYSKYSAGLLFVSLAIASAWVPEFRGIWRNIRLYLAAAIGLMLVLPHAVALGYGTSVEHAVGLVSAEAGVEARLDGVLAIASGFLLWLSPAWIILGIGILRGDCAAKPSRDGIAVFLRVLAATSVLLVLVLVVGLGLRYEPRYDSPLVLLVFLAAAGLLGFDAPRFPAVEKRILTASTLVALFTVALTGVVYSGLTGHSSLQEPTLQAAAQIEDTWSRTYSCGPAYVMGEPWTANGVSLGLRRAALAVPFEMIDHVAWFHRSQLTRNGAVVVFHDRIPADQVAAAFPGLIQPEVRMLTLPLLRTWAGAPVTYAYFFIPPANCPAKTTDTVAAG